LYTAGDLQGAKAIVHEIITQDNECISAYTLLSHIYHDMGMKTESVNALFSAAVNSGRDGALWISVARMSKDLGFWTQAIKCYDKYHILFPEKRRMLMTGDIDWSRRTQTLCTREVSCTENTGV